MSTINEALLQTASQPVQSIADVIAAFEGIDRILPESDGLKWFNGLYLNVTKAVDASVGNRHWNNPAWLTVLDVRFARLYLGAIAASLTPGQQAPGCWQVFFNARHDATLARVQFALAGMNAHIDHDLSIAVVESCRELGLTPAHFGPLHEDYCQVNGLLDALIDQTKRELMVGLLGNPLPAFGMVEDLVAGFGIRAAREVAWDNAELLYHAQAIPGAAEQFLNGLDRLATAEGAALLAPCLAVPLSL